MKGFADIAKSKYPKHPHALSKGPTHPLRNQGEAINAGANRPAQEFLEQIHRKAAMMTGRQPIAPPESPTSSIHNLPRQLPIPAYEGTQMPLPPT